LLTLIVIPAIFAVVKGFGLRAIVPDKEAAQAAMH
jgi:hypothetical protein